MYKSRLQELCHQRLWPAPDYTVSCDGPAHDSRFRASVTVSGVNFHAPDVSKSSKEAQSKAAQVAFDHFTANPPSKPSPQSPVLVESQISYKNQLQIYTQKNNVVLPKYDAVNEGYIHAPRFKANVTVDGQTFYSQQLFSTLKEAESDAAKVALSSLTLGENQNLQNDSSLYKNLLQELATKEGMPLPKYTTASNGACHMPIFSSTVETGGESFVGDVAATKKQAEMNAAKVAWFELKERLNANSGRASLSSSCSAHESLKPASSGSQPKDIRNLELPKSSSISPSHVKLNHNKENPDIYDVRITAENDSSTVSMAPIRHDDQGIHSKEITLNGNDHFDKADLSLHKMDIAVIGDSLSEDETSSSMESACNDPGIVDVNSETPMGGGASSLQRNRVRVHPNKPDIVLPEGAFQLPFSDDKWVAFSMDF